MAATVAAPSRAIVDATPLALRRALAAGAPAGIYLGLRAFGFLLWWAMAATRGRPVTLTPWDGSWYMLIAEHGYVVTNVIEPHVHYTPYTAQAFFPGFPWLVRVLSVPLGGHYLPAAVILTTAGGIAFAYGVRRLALEVTGSARAALLAVVLTAGAPMALVYNLAYPEVLLCALSAWALVALLEQRWLLAGLLACVAGTMHPASAAIVLVVLVAGAARGWKDRDRRTAWTALAPLGLGAYLAWVAVQTGELTGYSDIQRAGWKLELDGGRNTVLFLWKGLTDPALGAWGPVVVLLVVGAVIAAMVAAPRLPSPVWGHGLLVVALAVGTSGIMVNKPRELLTAFVLLIPLAAALARRSRLTTALVVGGYVVVGAWVSAYSLGVSGQVI